MLRQTLAAHVAAVLIAIPAPAQTTTNPAAQPPAAAEALQSQSQNAVASRSDRFLTQMSNTFMRGSKLVGVDVIGLDNVKVGEIDEVLVDRDGRVAAVVVGVGGFLGIGQKSVAIPFDMLLWNTGDVSRAATPSASVAPANAPQAGTTGPQAMPGANVDRDVLAANMKPPEAAGAVRDTGPATTNAAGTATIPVVAADGGPDRAVVRLTKADLERAPAFQYDRRASDAKP